jgi:hypothetical protein
VVSKLAKNIRRWLKFALSAKTRNRSAGAKKGHAKRKAARPKVVCLCGSSRFWREYQEAEYRETMAGNIYLSIGFYPHAAENMHGEGVGHDSVEKIALDELHKRKIDLADDVYVLNVGGYIGESTRSEIDYAIAHNKPVRYLEPITAPQTPEAVTPRQDTLTCSPPALAVPNEGKP